MKYIDTEKHLIKSWCNNPDDGAIEQAKNIANLPFIHKHVSLMPDFHLGFGMPIGCVIACKNVIIPNAVGKDGGCGVLAVKTSLKFKEIDQSLIKNIMSDIRNLIPIGLGKHHQKKQDKKYMPESVVNISVTKDARPICYREYDNARKSLGTLGSGNHFWEIQKDEDGFIWFMIHSGSRNLGSKVADHYNKLAVELNAKWYSSVPKSHDLAFLPTYTKEAQLYLSEMDYCLEFAKCSRDLMAERTKEAFLNHIECEFEESINIHHNYAAIENHFGANVWVHRKGATSAREGELGIIPGSQGTNSYIVKGLGNKESFTSCSHGAGRVMGRKQAQRELNLEDEINKLEDQGIIHSIRNVKDLDEATGAYKCVDIVMEEQKDLVEIVTKLSPLAVIKG